MEEFDRESAFSERDSSVLTPRSHGHTTASSFAAGT